MLGFESGTGRLGRFYKGGITKKFGTNLQDFLKISRLLYSFPYKMYKNIAYTEVWTGDLWLRSLLIQTTGPYNL